MQLTKPTTNNLQKRRRLKKKSMNTTLYTIWNSIMFYMTSVPIFTYSTSPEIFEPLPFDQITDTRKINSIDSPRTKMGRKNDDATIVMIAIQNPKILPQFTTLQF